MHKYKQILIIHALDESTAFLNIFEKEFPQYYISFTENAESINTAKTSIGDLDDNSLIIYLGHGSSSGLYLPSHTSNYENFFLDVFWGNHYFKDQDILLLSCKSEEFIRKMHKYRFAFGFGNIISSKDELKFHNEYAAIEKKLSDEDIEYFNITYAEATVKIIKLIISGKIHFGNISKYYKYFINSKINEALLNKQNAGRVELARILYEFRNEMLLVKTI